MCERGTVLVTELSLSLGSHSRQWQDHTQLVCMGNFSMCRVNVLYGYYYMDGRKYHLGSFGFVCVCWEGGGRKGKGGVCAHACVFSVSVYMPRQIYAGQGTIFRRQFSSSTVDVPTIQPGLSSLHIYPLNLWANPSLGFLIPETTL